MRIAVDMTPVVAGGVNGGVLPLTIETIKGFKQWENTDVVLITSSTNHDLLCDLDKYGCKRFCLVGEGGRVMPVVSHDAPLPTPLTAQAPVLPVRQEMVQRLKWKTKQALKRYAPSWFLRFAKRHRGGIKKMFWRCAHPVKGMLKPLVRFVMPHGLYVLYSTRCSERMAVQARIAASAAAASKVHAKPRYGIDCCSLSAMIGETIDVLYCPFSAVNFYDPQVATVSVINDIQHVYYPFFFAPQELEARKDFYDKLLRVHPQIVTISDFTKKTIVETYGCAEETVQTIYPSVQKRLSAFTDEEKQTAFQKFGFNKEEYIIYPANFWKHKNHPVLLTAFRMYLETHKESPLQLVLTGSAVDQQEAIKTLIDGSGLSDRVHHLGYVENVELAALISNSKYLIFPSLFEGFGIPVAEAMQLGTTVLCSNSTSLPEVGGDCAFYFDPRTPESILNCMEFVDENPAEVKKKKERYQEQLSKFDFDVYMEKYKKLFELLCKEKQPDEAINCNTLL